MSLFCSLVSLFVILITLSFAPNTLQAQENHTAFFIFGDSTVDTGNNNYILTIPERKANYRPYGRKGPDPDQPTGRFSDGRVLVDFIAEYAQLPSIPPILAPPLIKDYRFGVNFGSGGAGVLYSTNRDQGVIDLDAQLLHFELVDQELKNTLGDDKEREIISNAVYFFSIGSDDYLSGYSTGMIRPYPDASQYVNMVVGNLTNVIRGLYDRGARKFGFLGVSRLGCLPFTRAKYAAVLRYDECLRVLAQLAYEHNDKLMNALVELERLLPDFKYGYADLYSMLLYRMEIPFEYGYQEGNTACCGTGKFNGIYSCGGTKNVTSVYQVCENGDDYVFWDSLHLTEKTHESIARNLWEGSGELFVGYNLQQLFLNNQNRVIAAGEA